MARRSRGKATFGQRFWGWLVGAAGPVRRRRARIIVKVACLAGLVWAGGWGLGRLRGYVYGLGEYDRPIRLELVDLPSWLQTAANRHIVEQVIRAGGVWRGDRYLDASLVERVAARLARSGWVRRVVAVEKMYGGLVRARCEYRRPVAWVMHGVFYYLVDGEGVRLPGRYWQSQIAGSGMMPILGVRAGPPAVGRVWPGDDLQAGVRLARMLAERPFRGQITAVLVHNYGGREDARRAHIELATDRAGSRIRWGRAPGDELGLEPTAQQKLGLLEGLYRRYGRVDMGRRYVDVRRAGDRVDVPVGVDDDVAGLGGAS